MDADKRKKRYLVTGSAGFIGFHVAKRLLEEGFEVVGIDNFNTYYDPFLKEARHAQLESFGGYKGYRGDVSDLSIVQAIFRDYKIDVVCHLAAQAGVRHSLKYPYDYVTANLVGFVNVINEAKNVGVQHFVYASSSSVYGNQEKAPFSEEALTNAPLSLYAATKKANELVAHVYYHLYGMNCTGLRFFTVYGPWGRPDMAYFSFTESILAGKPITVFDEDHMYRDFTYIDDIVDGILKACESTNGYSIFNLGNDTPVSLKEFITILEMAIGKKALKEKLPAQPGDVSMTHADIRNAKEQLQWRPHTSLKEGIVRFVAWYNDYYTKKT